MAVTIEGTVATGTATPGDDHIDLTFSVPVLRSTPAKSVNLLVISEATGQDSALAIFTVKTVQDTAPLQPCYSDVYGPGNPYQSIEGAGQIIARDLVSSGGPLHALCTDLTWGVILHDIAAGDTLRLTYQSGASLAWGRAIAIQIDGVLQDPVPFPEAVPVLPDTWNRSLPEWMSGKSWGWNRFYPLYFGNSPTCHDGIPDNSLYLENVPFTHPFDQYWHWQSGSVGLSVATFFLDAGITSYVPAMGSVYDDYYNQGPDKLARIISFSSFSPPATSFAPNWAGCVNRLPVFYHNESFGIDGIILNEGPGTPYINPSKCHGGVILSRKFRNLPQGATGPDSPTGVTGANSVIVATDSHNHPQGADAPAGASGASGDHTVLVRAKHKNHPQGAP